MSGVVEVVWDRVMMLRILTWLLNFLYILVLLQTTFEHERSSSQGYSGSVVSPAIKPSIPTAKEGKSVTVVAVWMASGTLYTETLLIVTTSFDLRHACYQYLRFRMKE